MRETETYSKCKALAEEINASQSEVLEDLAFDIRGNTFIMWRNFGDKNTRIEIPLDKADDVLWEAVTKVQEELAKRKKKKKKHPTKIDADIAKARLI